MEYERKEGVGIIGFIPKDSSYGSAPFELDIVNKSPLIKKHWERYCQNPKNFTLRQHDGTELSVELSNKVMHCLVCRTPMINNWRRYCKANKCQYYWEEGCSERTGS